MTIKSVSYLSTELEREAAIAKLSRYAPTCSFLSQPLGGVLFRCCRRRTGSGGGSSGGGVGGEA